jgi:hypothetical protein
LLEDTDSWDETDMLYNDLQETCDDYASIQNIITLLSEWVTLLSNIL